MLWAMRNECLRPQDLHVLYMFISINTITIHSLYSSHMYRASVEVMVWYGDIESHTGGGVQSTLTLAASSRLTADTSPESAA